MFGGQCWTWYTTHGKAKKTACDALDKACEALKNANILISKLGPEFSDDSVAWSCNDCQRSVWLNKWDISNTSRDAYSRLDSWSAVEYLGMVTVRYTCCILYYCLLQIPVWFSRNEVLNPRPSAWLSQALGSRKTADKWSWQQEEG